MLEPIPMIRYFPLLILMFACSPTPSNEDCLEQLNNDLGTEYAEPLNELVNEFERLAMHSNGSGFADKCRNFLEPLSSGNEKEFYSQILKKEELLTAVFGLDTMIFKYQYFESNGVLTRKYIQHKWDSNFIAALSNSIKCNERIQGYVTTIVETGGIGPSLIARGALFNYSDEDFNDPIVKRILAVEILLPYLTLIPEQNWL